MTLCSPMRGLRPACAAVQACKNHHLPRWKRPPIPHRNASRNSRFERPVLVLLVAHLLSAALWFREAGCLGLAPLGMPALYFAWPAAAKICPIRTSSSTSR